MTPRKGPDGSTIVRLQPRNRRREDTGDEAWACAAIHSDSAAPSHLLVMFTGLTTVDGVYTSNTMGAVDNPSSTGAHLPSAILQVNWLVSTATPGTSLVSLTVGGTLIRMPRELLMKEICQQYFNNYIANCKGAGNTT